jgi:para-nitrobenzyl esterase
MGRAGVSRWVVAVVLCGFGLTGVGCSSGHRHQPTPAATSPRFPLAVSTDRGAVRGVVSADGRVENFLGIPYAAPPVGALRWQPPQPVAAWTSVRAAGHYGSVCAQPSSGDGPSSAGENCLYINVQRPSLDGARRRLPVYVYIHGGGLITGAGSHYDMAKIVRDTGVIGVTFNYRLGVFGFLAHPGLTGEQGQSGNYGFMDQQAALRWVRRNIAAFGGDPNRVTVGGESAGGWSVCAHLVSPGSRSLLAEAMIQSGACPSETQAEAEAAGAGFATGSGCGQADVAKAVACLRALPAGALIQEQDNQGFIPDLVRGTRVLPQDPASAVASGAFAHVPVVVGATLEEGRTFTVGDLGWKQSDYEKWVRSAFGPEAGAVIAEYPWPAGAGTFTGAYLSAAVLTDAGVIGPDRPPIETGIGGCGTQALITALARHTRVYAYEWSEPHGPGLFNTPGYADAAGHGSELAYLWPGFVENGVRIASLFDAGERQLSDQLVAYWGAFVKRGSPHVSGQPAWPRYAAPSGVVLSLQGPGQTRLLGAAAVSMEHHCALWNALAQR